MVLALTFATPRTAGAQQSDRQSIGTFSIDRAEVTIHAFAAFATATGLVTEAERAGAASSGPAVGPGARDGRSARLTAPLRRRTTSLPCMSPGLRQSPTAPGPVVACQARRSGGRPPTRRYDLRHPRPSRLDALTPTRPETSPRA